MTKIVELKNLIKVYEIDKLQRLNSAIVGIINNYSTDSTIESISPQNRVTAYAELAQLKRTM